MSLNINIVNRPLVKPSEQDEMYSVFSRYYVNADRSRFDEDLDQKNWVIQLRNPEACIVGFSTLQVYGHPAPSGLVTILYSGDTIIDRAHRLNGDLAGAFGHLILRAVSENPNRPVYWLLTSKGARTYRFLPVFFKTFFPAVDQPPPAQIKALIDDIALTKFGADYSPETQLVCHQGRRDWLCAAEHTPSLLARNDPHIRFFLARNPGHTRGDELVCLAAVTPDNLNARALRVITRTEVQWRE